MFHAVFSFLLGLFLDPEDGGDMFFRNDNRFTMIYTPVYSGFAFYLLHAGFILDLFL
jgi:hypothetical protein